MCLAAYTVLPEHLPERNKKNAHTVLVVTTKTVTAKGLATVVPKALTLAKKVRRVSTTVFLSAATEHILQLD
jgi:hypothetical protein